MTPEEDKAYNDRRRAETAGRLALVGKRLGLDLLPNDVRAAEQVLDLLAAAEEYRIWRNTVP